MADADAADNPAGGCLEVRSWRDSPSSTTYTRKTWNAEERILVAESSATASFDEVQILKWRYAAEGRIVAYLGIDNPTFQHDYSYDEHDNLTDLRLSYPDTPDLAKPSPATTWIGRACDNEYDDSGRLIASTVRPYGAGIAMAESVRRVYTEDDEGRCATIAASGSRHEPEKQTLTYDAAGRLARREIINPAGQEERCAIQIAEYEYDEKGRILSEHRRCDERDTGGSTHTYSPDGSERIELDTDTDMAGYRYSTLTRSAACLTIDADIGTPSSTRCRSE